MMQIIDLKVSLFLCNYHEPVCLGHFAFELKASVEEKINILLKKILLFDFIDLKKNGEIDEIKQGNKNPVKDGKSVYYL